MSEAARALGRAATEARALRSNAPGARDALATTLRDQALRVLAANGVPAQAREDLAQAVTVTVLARIVEGAVQAGFEDGYLAVAAKNRARDWHREASGVYEKTEAYDEDFLHATTPDPYAVLELAEDERHTQALVEKVAQVLRNAPQRYREALEAVYLEETPIDTLVDQEVFREWPWPDNVDPVLVRRRARARVDKLLQRARDWVRSRLVEARTTPPPPTERS